MLLVRDINTIAQGVLAQTGLESNLVSAPALSVAPRSMGMPAAARMRIERN